MQTYKPITNLNAKIMHRIVIYNKDVRMLTGKNQREATALLTKIRKHFSKNAYGYISSIEFSEYTGINLELINQHLIENPGPA
jgi:hypothetical protein